MKAVLQALALTVILSGCQPPRPASSAPAPDGAEAQAAPVTHVVDIGDVEQGLRLEGSILDEDRTPATTVTLEKTARHTISMCQVKVSPPYPESLFVTFRLAISKAFPDRPVVGRGRILRDGQVIGSFDTVLGKYAGLPEPPDGSAPPRREFRANVLEGLAAPPESMLVHAEMDVLLMPPGTDTAALDPATAAAAPNDTSTILSSPVRIEFVRTDAPS